MYLHATLTFINTTLNQRPGNDAQALLLLSLLFHSSFLSLSLSLSFSLKTNTPANNYARVN